MIDRFRYLLFLVVLFGFFNTSLYGQLPTVVTDPSIESEAKEVVNGFFLSYGMGSSVVHPDSIENYAMGWFAGYLEKQIGTRFWSVPHRYQVDKVFSIRDNDSLLMVTSRAWPDSVPLFGRLTVDWMWFLQKNEEEQWRIYSVRRTQGIYKAIQALRHIDTSAEYPNSLRSTIAYEESAIMLSNEQVRSEFPELRPQLEKIIDLLSVSDSIRFVGRNGDRG